jgi:eukaryotic-like serine/threonine-protein kinase
VERGDLTGAILDGRYRVLEAVAEGAMGVVYRAERLKLGRIVAVKVLHDVLPNELSARKRFEIEAMAMAKLEHPHCASVLDVGVHNQRPFVVMDFVSGDNLKDVIAGGPQPIGRAIEIVRQVLSGLAHAHEHGIIHRDIKPANLVLSHKTGLGDHVKILDFGLARLHDTGQNLTSGMVVGTPAYMAPEQIRGLVLDHRIDLYACGVLLFELLTGEKPYHSERDDPLEVCKLHLSAPVPRLDAKRPGVRFGELEAVIAKALAKPADDRYATAHDFAAALEALAPARPSRPALPPPASAAIQLASADVMPIDASYPPAIELRTGDLFSSDVAPAAERDSPGTFLGLAVVRPTPVPRAPSEPAPTAAEAATGEPRAATGDRQPATGDRQPATGDRQPATGEPRAATGDRRPAAGNRQPATGDPRAIAAPAAGRRSRGRLAVLAGGALIALAAVAIWAVTSRDAPAAAADAGVAQGSAALDPSGDIVTHANDLAARGERDAALDLLMRARKQDPSSGPLAYTAGRIYFSKFYWTDGLRSFREAIRLDPTYRTDPELIKTVLRGFITTPSYNDDLAGFLRDDIGGPARSFLEETARDHPNPATRSRAAGELRRYR